MYQEKGLYLPYNEILKKILKVPVILIGDTSQVQNIMYAIWNAYEVARNI